MMRLLNNIQLLTLFLLVFIFISANHAYSQIVAPVGISTKSSTQLVYWYDNTSDGLAAQNLNTFIQITNTNDTTPVTIHFQAFRSFDPTDQLADDADKTDVVRCEERDFIDVLTPNDTHVYLIVNDLPTIGDPTLIKNVGETENLPGDAASLNLFDSKGFIIITPVVSESDLSAISFQHMTGQSIVAGFGGNNTGSTQAFRVNAMGRDAVDFTTGELLPDGTLLDGVSNGLVVLQPEELSFNFVQTDDNGAEAFVVGITFSDSYGSPGLLGYNVIPGETSWTTFLYDWKEDPTSCGIKTNNCFFSIGVNEDIGDANMELDIDELLCGAVNIPPYPGGPIDTAIGWAKIAISGLDNLENQLGLVAFQERGQGGVDWMYTNGERTDTGGPTENCAVVGDEDGDMLADCADPDCVGLAGPSGETCEAVETTCDDGFDNDGDGATDGTDTDCDGSESCPSCEGGDQCSDGEDNDGDGNSDCADGGCDEATGPNGETCEAGVELTCNDNQDNDGDGTSDCDDPDCAIATNCIAGDGSGGGGCSVATTANPSMLNFLLPLIVIGLVIGIRRKR